MSIIDHAVKDPASTTAFDITAERNEEYVTISMEAGDPVPDDQIFLITGEDWQF